jgi:hypothetical protein
MPIAHGYLEPLLHAPAEHDAVLVIDTIGKFIFCVRSLESDRLYP